jgi:ABC-type polysaccharide/polyol phosphate transport system ATPase subunit
LKKLIKMRDKDHLIEEPHFTNQDNIYILAYAYGAKQIDMLLKDIKEFDEIEKAEAKPLFPI